MTTKRKNSTKVSTRKVVKKVAKTKTTKKTKNTWEKMADRGVAFRSPRFKKVGLVGKGARDYNDEVLYSLYK